MGDVPHSVISSGNEGAIIGGGHVTPLRRADITGAAWQNNRANLEWVPLMRIGFLGL